MDCGGSGGITSDVTRVSRALRSTVAAAVLLVAVTATTADAAQRISWSASGRTQSCTITSLPPTLNSSSRYLTISATVSCTVSMPFTLFMRAVELEGIGTTKVTEDTTNLMEVNAYYTAPGTLVANTPTTLTYTIRRTCVNTTKDLTDGEEYSTKAYISIVVGSKILTSAIDRSLPTNNQYAC